jgi:hypothetical protein
MIAVEGEGPEHFQFRVAFPGSETCSCPIVLGRFATEQRNASDANCFAMAFGLCFVAILRDMCSLVIGSQRRLPPTAP